MEMSDETCAEWVANSISSIIATSVSYKFRRECHKLLGTLNREEMQSIIRRRLLEALKRAKPQEKSKKKKKKSIKPKKIQSGQYKSFEKSGEREQKQSFIPAFKSKNIGLYNLSVSVPLDRDSTSARIPSTSFSSLSQRFSQIQKAEENKLPEKVANMKITFETE